MLSLFNSRCWRISEGILLFGLAPLLLALGWVPLGWGLLFGLVYVLVALAINPAPQYRLSFALRGNRGFAAGLRVVIIRFAAASLVLLGLVWVIAPDMLFSFMMDRPGLYLRVMIFYPLFSVIPQELMFRTFFFARYEGLFRSSRLFVLLNAVAFSWAHVFFGNWIALGGTLLAGLFFAMTYARTRSFYLVCVEHALYGSLVWTAGIGIYFYHAG